jgi:hypothetical protein
MGEGELHGSSEHNCGQKANLLLQAGIPLSQRQSWARPLLGLQLIENQFAMLLEYAARCRCLHRAGTTLGFFLGLLCEVLTHGSRDIYARLGSNCIDLVQPAFFFQCVFKQSCRGFDILGRSGFRSRHEHVLHLLPHWPNSEGLGEVLVDHVNRVTQRPDNFG